MKKYLLFLLLFPLFCLGQTNSIVTEYYLANHFTPKSGITPGTNNTLGMDCDQIVARYYVTISGVTTTGKREPSQSQLSASITIPIVITTAISSITDITASGGGNVTDDGDATVTARGIVWSTSTNPTIASYTGITSNGIGIGSFTSSLTSLNCPLTYYVKAYATNAAGTGYGSQVTFTAGYVSISDYSFWSSISSSCGTGDFTATYAAALQAYNDINNTGCTSKSVTGDIYKMTSTYTVGNQLYTTSQGCKATITGYYLSSSTVGANKIVYIVSGIVDTIYNLP